MLTWSTAHLQIMLSTAAQRGGLLLFTDELACALCRTQAWSLLCAMAFRQNPTAAMSTGLVLEGAAYCVSAVYAGNGHKPWRGDQHQS